MDISDLIRKLEVKIPGAILETKPFGRAGNISLWIELDQVAEVARFLKDEGAWRMDGLENFSAFESEGSLVLTWFLRSGPTGKAIILRGSVPAASGADLMNVPSVRSVWPMAIPFENEISSLFGVIFGNEKPDFPLFPKHITGFPLRKSWRLS